MAKTRRGQPAFDPADFNDPDAGDFNDPSIESLDPAPILHGSAAQAPSFGMPDDAVSLMGRATSPRLYAQAANYPNCQQLRVWKVENGVRVGLGVIDAQATEEDLVRACYPSMPKVGEGKSQFKLRPIDINGVEMGQEITHIIGEEHQEIRRLRLAAAGPTGPNGAPITMLGGMDPGLMRLMERQAELAEQRARALELQLASERERIQRQDEERARERIDLATSAASGVHALTERMMNDESRRASMALEQQRTVMEAAQQQLAGQSSTMLTTITALFSQQASAQSSFAEQQRRADEYRLEQERLRAERERLDSEERRKRDLSESEERRLRERQENEVRLRREQEEIQAKLQRERDELERKERQYREEQERKERLWREDMEDRRRRDAAEVERKEKLEREMAASREAERQRQHDRMLKEMDLAATQQREHAERMMQITAAQQKAETGGNLMDTIKNGLQFAKTLGIDPTEIIQRGLGGGGEEGGGGSAWAEAVPAVIKVIGDVVTTGMKARADQQASQLQLPMMSMLPPQYAPQPGTAMVPANAPTDTEAAANPADTQAAGAAPTAEGSATVSDARNAGLPLDAQKRCRVALREAATKVRNSAPEKWQEIILVTVANEPTVTHYCQAITIRRAFLEAGLDAEITTRLIDGLKLSGMLPGDTNYG
jgi:hypothetical protein